MENLDIILKEIKKDFFRYRNGVVAESLSKLYPKGKLVFGLNVPQLMEISNKVPKDLDLALSLWKDKNCRESRLLSMYLFPTSLLPKDVASDLIKDVDSMEEAEFLAFRVLRHLSYANDLYIEFQGDDYLSSQAKYCVEMLKRNLEQLNPL